LSRRPGSLRSWTKDAFAVGRLLRTTAKDDIHGQIDGAVRHCFAD
jgi:hypothetical protein